MTRFTAGCAALVMAPLVGAFAQQQAGPPSDGAAQLQLVASFANQVTGVVAVARG
ncbi:MAG TPA: hypothetical protein VEX11_09920 [Acetobacteraceae bacterium]|nr:hypothetical protein [Acetobacteraceae bacterium]